VSQKSFTSAGQKRKKKFPIKYVRVLIDFYFYNLTFFANSDRDEVEIAVNEISVNSTVSLLPQFHKNPFHLKILNFEKALSKWLKNILSKHIQIPTQITKELQCRCLLNLFILST
jgi:hypothetical protein